ncbi:MAG: hypothetical protein PWQ74_1341 [Methanobacteriaceae archaeon]|nr:hypothetical protein [Methanobacteriaceae archaeon]
MNKTLKELSHARDKIEDTLQELSGRAIFVPEVKIFNMACGCRGLLADLRGLETEEAEVFHKKIAKTLKGILGRLDLKADMIYARNFPGTYMIVGITARRFCGRCKRELGSITSRPDIIILKQ